MAVSIALAEMAMVSVSSLVGPKVTTLTPVPVASRATSTEIDSVPLSIVTATVESAAASSVTVIVAEVASRVYVLASKLTKAGVEPPPS